MVEYLEFRKGNLVDREKFNLEKARIIGFSKESLYNEIQILISGRVFDAIGPGAKEHKVVLEKAAQLLGIIQTGLGKIKLAEEITNYSNIIFRDAWSVNCFSVGDTITFDGYVYIYLSIWCFKNQETSINTISPNAGMSLTAPDSNLSGSESSDDRQLLMMELQETLGEMLDHNYNTYIPEDILSNGDLNVILIAIFDRLHIYDDTNNKIIEILELLGNFHISEELNILNQLVQLIKEINEFLASQDVIDDPVTLKNLIRNIIISHAENTTTQTKGQVYAHVRNHNINFFVDELIYSKLNLDPSFQRKDVWSIADSQKLIISILRGVPLPAIILQRSVDGTYTVVDGKQRLTSIFRFTGIHPTARKFITNIINGIPDISKDLIISLENEYNRNYKNFKFILKKDHKIEITSKMEIDNYLPFKLPKNIDEELGLIDSHLADKYYSDLVTNKVAGKFAGSKQDIFACEIFTNATIGTPIPVIIFDPETSNNQIQDIFTIYNKQGKKLSADEIRNASYHDLPLANVLMFCAGEKKIEDNMVYEQYSLFGKEFLSIEKCFEEYFKIPLNRFGRSKVLAYVTSFICDPDNLKISMSTTNRINTLYDEVNRKEYLKNKKNLENLINILFFATEIHQGIGDDWHQNFKTSKKNKNKWEDLQTVCSILGIVKALCYGDSMKPIEDLLKTNYNLISDYATLDNIKDSILLKSQEPKKNDWLRPAKAQSKIQNEYINRVSNLICETILEQLPNHNTQSLTSSIPNIIQNMNKIRL